MPSVNAYNASDINLHVVPLLLHLVAREVVAGNLELFLDHITHGHEVLQALFEDRVDTDAVCLC